MIFNCSSFQSGKLSFKGKSFVGSNFFNPLIKQQIYLGNNATQNQASIVFQKSDLTGLTPAFNNTAESLLVAIANRLIDTVGIDKRIEAEVSYWGAFTENNTVEKTIEIKFYNLLSVIDYEIQYSNVVSPMDY